MGRILWDTWGRESYGWIFLEIDILQKENDSAAVLSKNHGSLLSFSGLLNELGYYSISLCSSITQLTALLEMGKSFSHLIVDAFELDVNARSLEEIAWYQAISSFTLVADINSAQRQEIFRWAHEHDIPLRGVLQAPLRVGEFRNLVGPTEHRRGMSWHSVESCCQLSRA